MRPARSHALLGTTIAAALAVGGLVGTANANTTLPGQNGKILFTSTRDFPLPVEQTGLRGSPVCNSDSECAAELYSMNPDGSGATRLTNNTVYDDTGAWLPADGSQIAFEEDNTSGDTCCDMNIWSMGGDGSSPVQLTSDPGEETHPTYSPDGSKIAFAGGIDETAPATAAADRLIPPSDGEQIYVMPAGGETVGAPTPLLPADEIGDGLDSVTLDGTPSWSPDGTKIAFTRLSFTFGAPPKSGGSRLISGFEFDMRTYIAPADGSGPATALETYSPCGFLGLPLAEQQATANALVRAVTSGDARAVGTALSNRLFSSCTEDEQPAWSPDGTKIAVSRSGSQATTDAADRLLLPPDDEGDIVVIPVDNPAGEVNLSDLNEPSDCSDSTSDAPLCSTDAAPTWSPDGTKIAYESDRQSVTDGSRSTDCDDPTTGQPNGQCDDEIWTMNADGSGLTQLTNNAVDDTDPDWQRIPPPVPQTPTPPATPITAPASPKVSVAGVRRACVASAFHVRFRVATSSSVKSVVVKLDGKRIKSTSRGSFTLTINSKKLKAGRHRLTITATDAAGKVTTTHKSFSVCKAAKPRRRTAPRFTG